MMKKFLLCAALLGVLSPAWALDAQDAGEYVVLNPRLEPSTFKIRFYQRGTQWVLDVKEGNENWRAVCHDGGRCRMRNSSAAELARYKTWLPRSMRRHHLSCIENVLFAFCRLSDADNANHRLYWFLTLLGEARGRVLGVNRIR